MNNLYDICDCFFYLFFKITISYVSGKRTQLVKKDHHKKLCKAIFKAENVECSVINIIANSNPDDVVDAATKIISNESRELCKRNSGSVMQMKDYKSLMTFTWNKFNTELEIRAPNVLKVVRSIVCDLPVSPGEKKYMNNLHSISSAFHGRSQEMSGLHYCIAFVLIHGGCTLRVSIACTNSAFSCI